MGYIRTSESNEPKSKLFCVMLLPYKNVRVRVFSCYLIFELVRKLNWEFFFFIFLLLFIAFLYSLGCRGSGVGGKNVEVMLRLRFSGFVTITVV